MPALGMGADRIRSESFLASPNRRRFASASAPIGKDAANVATVSSSMAMDGDARTAVGGDGVGIIYHLLWQHRAVHARHGRHGCDRSRRFGDATGGPEHGLWGHDRRSGWRWGFFFCGGHGPGPCCEWRFAIVAIFGPKRQFPTAANRSSRGSRFIDNVASDSIATYGWHWGRSGADRYQAGDSGGNRTAAD
jgi:hypothetical protein